MGSQLGNNIVMQSHSDHNQMNTKIFEKGNGITDSGFREYTPLSLFVRERLAELGLKQADFCRLNSFDQGMLSRIQNSVAFNLNLESVLRLAIGLKVSPCKLMSLIGRMDLHNLILAAYVNELPELAELNRHTET